MSEGHHRGAHPDDRRVFAPAAIPVLRRATEEVSWLLGRDYPISLAVRAAGDRHQLEHRARLAVTRAAAAPDDVARRAQRRVPPEALRGQELHVDLFNVVITLELALGGGVLLGCVDGPLRDLAGLRGSYHPVAETDGALGLLGDALTRWAPARCVLWIDAPVSNSGRLRARVHALAAGWPTELRTEMVPDADVAMRGRGLVASADAVVIDGAAAWCNLARAIVEGAAPDAWVVELSA